MRSLDLKLLILDEPTHGLHPSSIAMISVLLKSLNAKGIAILLVEQTAMFALGLAKRGYLMQHGEIVLKGEANELLRNNSLFDLYLAR